MQSDVGTPTGPSLTDLDRTVLGLVAERFPLSSAPYCDLAAMIDAAEVDVLNSVLKMRETGVIERIGPEFDDARIGFCTVFDAGDDEPGSIRGVELTCDEAELAMLLQGDLPYGEHPYEELAAELQQRGVDAGESWVLDRIRAWTDAAMITRLAAFPADVR